MLVFMLQVCMFVRLLRCASTFTNRRPSRVAVAHRFSDNRIRGVFSFPMLRVVDKDVLASLNELSPIVMEAPNSNESALLSHLRTRITWALETWIAEDSMDANIRAEIAKKVVVAIIENRKLEPVIGDARHQNKMLVDYGSIVAKALRATPGSLAELNDDIKVLDVTITKYQQHLEKNRAVYININKHHESLIKKSYAAAVSDVTSLNEYADAANLMGKKVWVQEGNMWMEEFSLNFFRRNGARKDYLKSKNHDPANSIDRIMAEALPRDLMLEETFIKEFIDEETKEVAGGPLFETSSDFQFRENLPTSSSSSSSVPDQTSIITSSAPILSANSSRLIRLVDVGSCYNPIAKSTNKAAFQITALDLCPVDTSVYQCDFLDLEIGDKGTEPLIVPVTVILPVIPLGSKPTILGIPSIPEKDLVPNTDSTSTMNSAYFPPETVPVPKMEERNSVNNISPKLIRLPKASYDVVTMSLVLNYLPTPELRENMIKKARELLISPGEGGQPHRAGLLLIIEKESIFTYENDSKKISTQHNHTTLLNCWKDTICSFGFELVRYRNILTSQDNRRCHALAFKTKNVPLPEEHSSPGSSLQLNKNDNDANSYHTNSNNSAVITNDNLLLKNTIANKLLFDNGKSGMWIKQDFLNSIDVEKVEKRVSAGGKIFESKKESLKIEYTRNANKNSKDSIKFDDPNSNDNGNDEKNDNNSNNSSSNSHSNSVDIKTDILPIAIVGGGLGGTALALALQRKGLPFVILEKDSNFTSRKQGYALTLQQV